jgi:predicted nucleotidyltransferase component of viral defense system
MRRQIVEVAKGGGAKAANVLRELLQWEILAAMHGAEAFREVAFVGGTCLRLMHGLRRFSEDLDFSARGGDGVPFLEGFPRELGRFLESRGFGDAEVSVGKSHGAVRSLWVRFPGVLKEVGASPMASQKIGIKLEFDLNPPPGADFSVQVVSTPALMAVGVHDLPSLMAGKLHAVLARSYTKGRDWYDLLWYLGKKVEPNIGFLQNALDQQSSKWCADAGDWRAAARALTLEADWAAIHRDVGPFLESGSEIGMLQEEIFLAALELKGGLKIS